MDEDVTRWLGKLKEGDEDAANVIWNRFFQRVERLAERRLGNLPNRESDAEDIALSALNALCVGARDNKFRKLENREDLWQLLAMITNRKAAQAWRKKSRKHEAGESVLLDGDGGGGLAEMADEGMLDAISTTCDELLASLDDERLRQVAILRLEGNSNQEIAATIGRSVKSVERYLQLIRATWTTMLNA